MCGPGGRLVAEARASGVPVHVVDDLVRRPDPRRDLRTVVRLAALFRRRGYRLVHTHSTKAGLLGRLAAWLAGVPAVVHTVHGFPFEMGPGLRTRAYSAVERLAALLTDRVVCVGEVLRRQVEALGMAPGRKLVTIYSGLDFAACRPRRAAEETKRRLGVEGAWPIVGSVGYLMEAKAQHDLIEAAARLVPRYPRLVLLLVGEGPLRPFLERRIADLGVGAHARLLGERDDVADLLPVFDVYAMSSRREGVGRALSEAMYAGLPVVTTAVAGVTELVADEETGLLVPPRNPERLAAAIDRLVADPALARRLGAAAGRRARELMSVDRMIADLVRLYDDLLASAPRDRFLWESLRRI